MHDRIKQLRTALNLTQRKFADALNLSQNYIATIETTGREPSARTISDICRIYGADEHWLRTGEGEMLRRMPDGEALAAAVGELPLGRDAEIKRYLISAVLRMPPEALALVVTAARQISAAAGDEKEEAGQ